jgi:hypothetical protein
VTFVLGVVGSLFGYQTLWLIVCSVLFAHCDNAVISLLADFYDNKFHLPGMRVNNTYTVDLLGRFCDTVLIDLTLI